MQSVLTIVFIIIDYAPRKCFINHFFNAWNLDTQYLFRSLSCTFSILHHELHLVLQRTPPVKSGAAWNRCPRFPRWSQVLPGTDAQGFPGTGWFCLKPMPEASPMTSGPAWNRWPRLSRWSQVLPETDARDFPRLRNLDPFSVSDPTVTRRNRVLRLLTLLHPLLRSTAAPFVAEHCCTLCCGALLHPLLRSTAAPFVEEAFLQSLLGRYCRALCCHRSSQHNAAPCVATGHRNTMLLPVLPPVVATQCCDLCWHRSSQHNAAPAPVFRLP